MNGTEDVDKSDWKQEAIRLLDSFEHLSESYEDELPTLPPIEFILVQDTRSEGHVGLGETVFDRHHRRAKRRLKPLFELPVDEQWWDENRSVESRTRVFCTNMPKRDPHDSPKDVQSSSLLGFRNQMQRLFRKGDGLLKRPPFALPQMRQWPLHRRDNVTEEVTVNPRSLSITNGIQWLSLLFEASWGPADAFRLKNERWTYRQSSEIGSDRTRSTLVHWTDVPEDNPLFSGCFFSISQNVLDDCARLTKWLLSLWDASAKAMSRNEPLIHGKGQSEEQFLSVDPKRVEAEAAQTPAAAPSSVAGGPIGTADKADKPKRGRPKGSLTTNPSDDHWIANQWRKGKGRHSTYKALAEELQKPEEDVRAAVKRHNQRSKKSKVQ